MRRRYDARVIKALIPLLLLAASCAAEAADKPVRVAVAGLVHGHVDGFFRLSKTHPEMEVAGIFDPDTSLHEKYAAKYGFKKEIFFTDLSAMLAAVKPDAVAAFSSTFDHAAIVEACAAKKIAVMMEKPMAVNMAHARRIQNAVKASGIPLIVNYETTWYASHTAIWKLFKEDNAAGNIRKMVAMDGHDGPAAINVSKEFLTWLTDPVKNGAGALYDFGCYGANLMTWLMNGERPVSVTAIGKRLKPQTYPRVEDEAEILVEYKTATGIIQGSWDWPYARKDLEVYAEKGYAVATGGNSLRTRLGSAAKETEQTPPAQPAADKDSVAYLVSVVRGRKVEGLSSLENNMIVSEILAAARDSIHTGKKVILQ